MSWLQVGCWPTLWQIQRLLRAGVGDRDGEGLGSHWNKFKVKVRLLLLKITHTKNS
jgi:hypothetical protein